MGKETNLGKHLIADNEICLPHAGTLATASRIARVGQRFVLAPSILYGTLKTSQWCIGIRVACVVCA